MLLPFAAALLLLLGGLTGALARSGALPAGTSPSPSSLVPGGYIVEFADDAEQHIAKRTRASASDISVHDEFHKYLARALRLENARVDVTRGKRDVLRDFDVAISDVFAGGALGVNASSAYTVRHSWDRPGVFRGVSVVLASDGNAHLLSGAPGVINVERNRVYPKPDCQLAATPLDLYQKRAAALQAVSQTSADQSTNAVAASVPDALTPHRLTGVDRLHAEGYLGKGMTVGIIDSGVDYTHPALNGGKPSGTACFGKPECQVIGGKNFGDGDPNDPFGKCNGHGTNVASVVAARAYLGSNITG